MVHQHLTVGEVSVLEFKRLERRDGSLPLLLVLAPAKQIGSLSNRCRHGRPLRQGSQVFHNVLGSVSFTGTGFTTDQDTLMMSTMLLLFFSTATLGVAVFIFDVATTMPFHLYATHHIAKGIIRNGMYMRR